MSSKHPPHDDWIPCAKGELRQAVSRLRVRHRNQHRNQSAQRVLAAGLVVVLAVWAGLYAARRGQGPREYDFGGITCSQFRSQLEPFMAGRLDEAAQKQMQTHLAECPACGPLAEKMKGAMSQVRGGGCVHGDSQDCDCPGCSHRT